MIKTRPIKYITTPKALSAAEIVEIDKLLEQAFTLKEIKSDEVGSIAFFEAIHALRKARMIISEPIPDPQQ